MYVIHDVLCACSVYSIIEVHTMYVYMMYYVHVVYTVS